MRPSDSRKLGLVLISILVIFCASLAIHYPITTTVLAQDEPTDRPFPTAAPKTTVPKIATSASGAADTAGPAETTPTTRPFPSAVPKTIAPESATSAGSAATATVVATASAVPQTPTLSSDSALATITAMQAETKDLQDKLASAQGDKGATLYAIVVVVIGVVLSSGVFFGLKRSGK